MNNTQTNEQIRLNILKDFEKSKKPKQLAVLILFIGICYLVAWAGAQVSPGIASAEWYESIQKPDWNPPAWVFGPVWTILYTLMGIAAWLIWRDFGFKNAKLAMSLFFLQLLLNGLWSHIFFGLQEIGWALAEMIFLLAAIIATTIAFFQKKPIAGWIMVPYILWVTFATFLTYTIWSLN